MSSLGIKIAITGGPSGGKTTLLETLKKDLGFKVTVVPEAASILYRGGFPRLKTPSAKIHTQKAIYHLQHELEELLKEESKAHLLVCDRGSLDGIAYWPHTEENFFQFLNTTREQELHRYDWIIHLDTANKDSYDTENPLRTESYHEAQELNEKIRRAWRNHPQRIIIPQTNDFYTKLTLCLKVIHSIGAGDSFTKVMELLT